MMSAGTRNGKTTGAKALAAFLPPGDRVVLVEDTAEVQIDARTPWCGSRRDANRRRFLP